MFAWLWLGGVGFAQEAPAPATLSGRVVERGSGLPVTGRVTVGGVTVDTDAAGGFTLVVPAGASIVVVDTEDHLPLEVTETLEPGAMVEVVYRVERGSWN